MIWKDYLKLSEIASYSKLARVSKAPPPSPPRRSRVNLNLNHPGLAYDNFDRGCVVAHNKYRKMHGTGRLYWSETLAAEAQEWAENLAQSDKIENDKSLDSMQSESIHSLKPAKPKCQGAKSSECVSCSEIVEEFYKEGENYDYQTGKAKDKESSVNRFARVSLIKTALTFQCNHIYFFYLA